MEETSPQQQIIDQQALQPILKDGRTNSILEYNLLYKNTMKPNKPTTVPTLVNNDIPLVTKDITNERGWSQPGVQQCFVAPIKIDYMTTLQSYHNKMLDRIVPPRMRPYFVPIRSRTKSENSDTATVAIINALNEKLLRLPSMMDTCDNNIYSAMETNQQLNNNNLSGFITNSSNLIETHRIESINILKKYKSLEDVRAENLDGSQPSHEMEFVSSRIQKLKVTE